MCPPPKLENRPECEIIITHNICKRNNAVLHCCSQNIPLEEDLNGTLMKSDLMSSK